MFYISNVVTEPTSHHQEVPGNIRQNTNNCQRLIRKCLKQSEYSFDMPFDINDNGDVLSLSYTLKSNAIDYGITIADTLYPVGTLTPLTEGEEIVNLVQETMGKFTYTGFSVSARLIAAMVYEWKSAIEATIITDKFGYLLLNLDYLPNLTLITFDEQFEILSAHTANIGSGLHPNSTLVVGEAVQLSQEHVNEVNDTILNCFPKYTDYKPNSGLKRLNDLLDSVKGK
ncbi:hypothetical protein [Vibrio harveyi]|uniref:hypothetical protein n=1 Tax=Vibrio harveyi TaxID=669 RepID=UPI003CF3527F